MDERFPVTPLFGRTIHVDVQKKILLGEFIGGIKSVLYFKQGSLLFIFTEDSTIRIWDIYENVCLHEEKLCVNDTEISNSIKMNEDVFLCVSGSQIRAYKSQPPHLQLVKVFDDCKSGIQKLTRINNDLFCYINSSNEIIVYSCTKGVSVRRVICLTRGRMQGWQSDLLCHTISRINNNFMFLHFQEHGWGDSDRISLLSISANKVCYQFSRHNFSPVNMETWINELEDTEYLIVLGGSLWYGWKLHIYKRTGITRNEGFKHSIADGNVDDITISLRNKPSSIAIFRNFLCIGEEIGTLEIFHLNPHFISSEQNDILSSSIPSIQSKESEIESKTESQVNITRIQSKQFKDLSGYTERMVFMDHGFDGFRIGVYDDREDEVYILRIFNTFIEHDESIDQDYQERTRFIKDEMIQEGNTTFELKLFGSSLRISRSFIAF